MKRISFLKPLLFSLLILQMPLQACSQEAEKDSYEIAVITVSAGGKEQGKIKVWLYEETVLHRENFLKLAKEGFYDGTTFHRVIKNFMVQGGDPNSKDDDKSNDGQGGPGYTIQAEIDATRPHLRGRLAAARQGDQVNPDRRSSGSQFYIVHGRKASEEELNQVEQNVRGAVMMGWLQSDYLQREENKWVQEINWQELAQDNMDSVMVLQQKIMEDAEAKYEEEGNTLFHYSDEVRKEYLEHGGAPHLDGQYTVFGEVLEGMDVVDWMADQPTEMPDRPLEDLEMTVKIETLTAKEVRKRYPHLQLDAK